MKCYYHQSEDAVGLCRSCQRGLCEECAVDLDRGLACRNRCEATVRSLIELIDLQTRHSATSRSLVAGARRTGMIFSVFFLAMGIIFIGWSEREGMELGLLTIMGIAFLALGLVHFVRSLRVAPVSKAPNVAHHALPR